MINLADAKRKVLVTGGASGIGQDIGALLHSQGWQVHLVDLNSDLLLKARETIGLSQDQIHVADVSDEGAINAIVERIVTDGPIAALVNSAGVAIDKPLIETEVTDFKRMIDINLIGTFVATRAAARHWIRSDLPGAVVNISSVSGIMGSRGRSAYGASKGAINQLTRILATELGPKKIRVNTVAPGAIDTPLSRAVHTEDVRNQWNERIPMARYGTVREVASTVAFLISDEASYVNGQLLAVDGGFCTAGLMVTS